MIIREDVPANENDLGASLETTVCKERTKKYRVERGEKDRK